jgi:integrase
VPVIRLHDLRHTPGTLLIKAGVPVKVVSERLGHATPAFTIDTYQHVLPGMQPTPPASSNNSSSQRFHRHRPAGRRPG